MILTYDQKEVSTEIICPQQQLQRPLLAVRRQPFGMGVFSDTDPTVIVHACMWGDGRMREKEKDITCLGSIQNPGVLTTTPTPRNLSKEVTVGACLPSTLSSHRSQGDPMLHYKN